MRKDIGKGKGTGGDERSEGGGREPNDAKWSQRWPSTETRRRKSSKARLARGGNVRKGGFGGRASS